MQAPCLPKISLDTRQSLCLEILAISIWILSCSLCKETWIFHVTVFHCPSHTVITWIQIWTCRGHSLWIMNHLPPFRPVIEKFPVWAVALSLMK
jgi:hypothetical protein